MQTMFCSAVENKIIHVKKEQCHITMQNKMREWSFKDKK